LHRGKPVQNAFVESFNSRLHDELLDVTLFDRCRMPRALPERWRTDYDADSGLPLADATSLRRKLAWPERAMG
jgi:hypothetical protein